MHPTERECFQWKAFGATISGDSRVPDNPSLAMPLPNLRLLHPRENAEAGSARQPLHDASAAARTPSVEELFQRYAADVAARGVIMLGSAAEADDLVQDVFLRAFRSIKHLSDPRAVRPWLMTIAVREAMRRLRKRRVIRFFSGSSELAFEQLAAPEASPEVKLQIARVFRVLDGLQPELRIAWALRHLEVEPLEEIAAQCGWSLSTTKRRIAVAQAKMKEGLGT